MFEEGDFYIELQDHGLEEERRILRPLVSLARDIGVKVVLAPDIIDCVAKGAGIALDNIDTVTEPTHIFHKKAYIRD